MALGDSLHDQPEWLEEFAENLVDGEASVTEADSPREPSIPEPIPKEEYEEAQCVYTHLTKDPNCEVCKRINITRAPFRKRASDHIPRADKLGELIMADHKSS